MKEDIKKVKTKATPIIKKIRPYMVVFYILLFFVIYSFLVFRIGTLTAAEPTDDEIQEKLKTVRRPKIDEEAAAKIRQLETQNIEVRSLFNEARRNPFSE